MNRERFARWVMDACAHLLIRAGHHDAAIGLTWTPAPVVVRAVDAMRAATRSSPYRAIGPGQRPPRPTDPNMPRLADALVRDLRKLAAAEKARRRTRAR